MMKEKPVIASLIGVLLGAVIMSSATRSAARSSTRRRRGDRKAPLPDPQALVGAALGMVLRWKVKPLATLAGKLGETVG